MTLYFRNGVLVDSFLLDSFTEKELEIIIESLKKLNLKYINLEIIKKNKLRLIEYLNSLNIEQNFIESFKNKLGFEEKEEEQKIEKKEEREKPKFFQPIKREIAVNDFVDFYRHRFNYLKEILKERKELENLISIDKLSKNNRSVSIIGMVYEKRETKNRNIILALEDGKGSVNVLISKDKEVYKKALNVVEDEVIGVKGFGNKEIIFASDIIFPEIINQNQKKCKEDKNIVFISDIHVGSEKFLESNFRKFIKWVNGEINNDEKVKKISHIFILGDLVDGVGIYPGQENELSIKDIKEQYKYLAEILKEIRKDIKIVLLPGNHDAANLLEPQTFTHHAQPLVFENSEFLQNPCFYEVYGYSLLLYHGYSLDYYANYVDGLKQFNPYQNPRYILRFFLSKRHLAPSHGSTLYYPLQEDFLLIDKVPDLFVTAHIHKSDVDYFRNIFLISTSCWQARTKFQEKMGHEPDPCKAVIFNTKSKKINIVDFS
jgi:DNA polymerase II small subunit